MKDNPITLGKEDLVFFYRKENGRYSLNPENTIIIGRGKRGVDYDAELFFEGESYYPVKYEGISLLRGDSLILTISDSDPIMIFRNDDKSQPVLNREQILLLAVREGDTSLRLNAHGYQILRKKLILKKQGLEAEALKRAFLDKLKILNRKLQLEGIL